MHPSSTLYNARLDYAFEAVASIYRVRGSGSWELEFIRHVDRLCGEQDLSPAAVEECDANLKGVCQSLSFPDVLIPLGNMPLSIALSFRHLRFKYLGRLTANSPTAVTTLLFSLSVKARSVDCAKLGSARVRPLPETCLGGILDISGRGCIYKLSDRRKVVVASQCRTISVG